MHETIRVGEMSVTFLKTRHETGGVFDLFELIMPAFHRVPLPHIHRKYDETIFGVDGSMTWTLHDKPHEVSRGVTLFIPRGTPHSYANPTHTPGRVLCLQTPGVMGPEYFREVRQLLSAGPPNPVAMAETMRRHGMIPVMPASTP